MRASVAIIVVLGLVLAVIGSSEGPAVDGKSSKLRPRSGAAASGATALDPNVALRILAREPTRMLPQLARRIRSVAPEVTRALRRESAAIGRAGVDFRRDLLARLSVLSISLERSCPPPAILACRPAIRIFGRLRERPPADLQRKLRTTLIAALRAAGFRSMVAEGSHHGDQLSGRVTARGETLARWRLSGGVLEIATGGLHLKGAEMAPGEDSLAPASVETNPRVLETLLNDSTY